MPKGKKEKLEKRFVLVEHNDFSDSETWHKNITSVRSLINKSKAKSFSVRVVIIKLVENEGDYTKKSDALYALECFNE